MSGSSAAAFSSASRAFALSQSKMPPQQGYCLLDFIDNRFDFGAHKTVPWGIRVNGGNVSLKVPNIVGTSG